MTIRLAINLLIALLFLLIGFGIGQIVAEIQIRMTLKDVFGELTDDSEDEDNGKVH